MTTAKTVMTISHDCVVLNSVSAHWPCDFGVEQEHLRSSYWLKRLLLVGYHGELKVNLCHDIRII